MFLPVLSVTDFVGLAGLSSPSTGLETLLVTWLFPLMIDVAVLSIVPVSTESEVSLSRFTFVSMFRR